MKAMCADAVHITWALSSAYFIYSIKCKFSEHKHKLHNTTKPKSLRPLNNMKLLYRCWKHLWRISRTFSIGQLGENKLTKPICSCFFSSQMKKKDIQCLSSFSHHAHLFNLRITQWYAWFIYLYNLVHCGFIEWVVGQIYEEIFCKHQKDYSVVIKRMAV